MSTVLERRSLIVLEHITKLHRLGQVSLQALDDVSLSIAQRRPG
jgi:hypothetical protein